MYDDNSFSTDAYDTNSWLFDLVQAAYARGRRLFVLARHDIIQVLQRVSDMWVQKRG